MSKPTAAETELWRHLWSLPQGAWWIEQQLSGFIVARYVRLSATRPESAQVARLEDALGLTPMAMARLRLLIEPEEPEPAAGGRYLHVKVED